MNQAFMDFCIQVLANLLTEVLKRLLMSLVIGYGKAPDGGPTLSGAVLRRPFTGKERLP